MHRPHNHFRVKYMMHKIKNILSPQNNLLIGHPKQGIDHYRTKNITKNGEMSNMLKCNIGHQ